MVSDPNPRASAPPQTSAFPLAWGRSWSSAACWRSYQPAAYTSDAEGLITFFNRQAAELGGASRSSNDPMDRFCGSFQLFAADGSSIRHDQCWMARALQENGYNGHEIVVERPDGSRLPCLAHANPIHDEPGCSSAG